METVATLHLAAARAGQNAVDDALAHAERALESALEGGYAPPAAQARGLLESLLGSL